MAAFTLNCCHGLCYRCARTAFDVAAVVRLRWNLGNLLDGDLVYLAGVLVYVGVVTVLRDFLNFGDDDIAVPLELLTPRRHLQGSLDLVGRSHPREEHVAVVHVHHFRRLISKHFRVDAALENVVIEFAGCDPIQAEYSLRDDGVRLSSSFSGVAPSPNKACSCPDRGSLH